MPRTACIDIRALPLQLLLRAHPQWRALPVVVVDRDQPTGLILCSNEAAMQRRIYPGMRYAAGLGLSSQLQGGAVSQAQIEEAVEQITRGLWSFSPRIEPSHREPGIFWLDVSSLRFLFPSLEAWANEVRIDLREAGFRCVVAVGFSRFGPYAAARSKKENIVFQSPHEEQAHVRRVPVVRLGFAPALRDTLLKLGIEDVGGFIDLPPQGIRRRFGADAAELHKFARGDGWAPLEPAPLAEPVVFHVPLDYPEENADRLLAAMHEPVARMLDELASRHEEAAALSFTFTLDNGEVQTHEVAPASATHQPQLLLGLCRLRMENLRLPSGVVEIGLRVEGTALATEQMQLLPELSQKNMEAAQRAFARIRAEWGSDAVKCTRLHEGHLPEACYTWEPLQQLPAPRPTPPAMRPLVRRLYTPPLELPSRERREPDGWMVAGFADGPVDEVIGPHIINGGWWMRELNRLYYFVRTRSGRWLWVYHDIDQRRWYMEGEVI